MKDRKNYALPAF